MSLNATEQRPFDLLFDERMTDRTTAAIAERLRYQRANRLMTAWKKHRERTQGFAPLSAAVAFFRGLEAIARQADKAVLQCVDCWPVSYFLSRNYEHLAEEELAYGRLAADLLYSSMPDGTSPLAGLKFSTRLEGDGSLLALGAGGRLFIGGLTASDASLIWSVSERTAVVTSPSAPQSRIELDLPLRPADLPSAAFRPNAVTNGFQIQVLEDGANVLFNKGYRPDGEDTASSQNTVADKLLTVTESVSTAHDILSVVWPEVIPWARALVPAVADLGPRDSNAARLSGSFGAGEPIYLSQVSNPLLHAEDLIHEVQHLRFSLEVRAHEWFAGWNNEEELFISPYRSDLRPIAGIHLGLHAFLAVTEFALRALRQPGFRDIASSWLYDTHLRNVFAFHTIASHERLSSEGTRYYRQLGAVLANQHSRVTALVPPAEREQIMLGLNWPTRPLAERQAAVNASIDIREVAAGPEMVGLVA